ncbi:MAG: 4-alpha-glucanotransferase [Oscillospiraceae bacterium]|nr:4-alpha-glucanotransferase [Oscillospiraceae bacterium]
MSIKNRCSAVLMPMSSLPSPHGIGTLGQCAYDFIDFLKAAGQKYWQLLPLGPTGYGDSPYSSFSTFAGNPYFIDLDVLAEEGFLTREEIEGINWGDDEEKTDYGTIYNHRYILLWTAFERKYAEYKEQIRAFRRENPWVENYALYMSIKEKFNDRPWMEWEDEAIKRHEPAACEEYRRMLLDHVNYQIFLQFLFFRQWNKLRAYAKKQGIGFIGDIPIYVAMDSADIWSEAHFFQLTQDYVPSAVAGVPPDAFTEDGQLWGNPLYNWKTMQDDGYGWWIRRVEGANRLFDIIRIDHFRGFESYWSVPYGADTAKKGKWCIGPGIKLVGMLTQWFPDITFIAEDLGIITPGVRALLDESGLPGMKVLQFAFDGSDNAYLPHNISKNSVCYVGTHDNETTSGWVKNPEHEKELAYAQKYLGIPDSANKTQALIRAGMASTSILFVVTMQDLLELGAEARMNCPGKSYGNWTWRMKKDAITPELTEKLLDLTRTYHRQEEPKKAEKTADETVKEAKE